MLKEDIRNAPDKEKRILKYVMIGIAFTVLIIYVVFRYNDFANIMSMISNAVMPFLCGLVVAFILNTFVNLFEKVIFKPLNRRFEKGRIWNRIRRPITLVLSYLIVVALICLIVFFIIPELVNSGQKFAVVAAENAPIYWNNFMVFLTDTIEKLNLDIDINTIQNTFFGNFDINSIISNATQVTTDLLGGLISATMNVASGVFTLIMSVIYSAYFLSGKENLIKTFKKLLYAYAPRKTANHVSLFLSLSNNVFSSYVKGQLTECLILGSLCYIGMNIIGLDYALLISCTLTISALIPILGAYIGAGIGAIVLLMVHPIDAVWFLIFLVCLQQFEGNVIYPRVVGSSIGLPGIWTLTAVMTFGSLFGIPGIIIGTPAAAVIYRLLKYKTSDKLKEKAVSEDILMGSEVEANYADVLHPKPVHDEEPEEEVPYEELSFFEKIGYNIRHFFLDLIDKIRPKKKGKH